MEALFIGLIIIALVIIIGLPFLCVRLIRRKSGILNILTPAAIWFVIVYNIWTAFYPNKGFYIKEFETETGYPFPESGEFIFKDASYPDQHGDYIARAAFEMSKQDFIELQKKISGDTPVEAEGNTVQEFPHSENVNNFNPELVKKIKSIYTIHNKSVRFTIGFLSDTKTVVFEGIR